MKIVLSNIFQNIMLYEFAFIMFIITSYILGNDIFILISNLLFFSILTIMIHELGHFLIGKIIGMKLYMISLVLFIFVKNKFYYNYPFFLALGVTNMYKEDWTKGVKTRDLLWYILGGPLFNLITIIVTYLSKFLFENSNLDYFIILNIAVLVMTGSPIIKENDGYYLFDLIKKKKKSNFYKAYLKNSLILSEKINIYNHQKLFFSISDAFSWNVVYLHGKITDKTMSYEMKQNYNTKYEKNIIDFYLVCLGYKSKHTFEFKSISPVYGKCIYYLKKYIQHNEIKYLTLARKNKDSILDNHQMALIEYIIKKSEEGHYEE
ncbi:site-2 protease family protein [Staphylococcus kloosii]|uniref:site-2 protease family protein n=1 Tax=Staphylococcus kloosii TaxID=29384 RepID=UPI0018A03D50|nr:site-2 protease family protein [Staphylococcus kloosii]MBF7023134.1 site-2 protease family protein [Staphylococcus kloosii]